MSSRAPDEDLLGLLRALRTATSGERPSSAVEERLLEAFEQQRAALAFSARRPVAPSRRSVLWRPAARWLALAASLALVAAAGAGLRMRLMSRDGGAPPAASAGGERPVLGARALRPDIDHSAVVMATTPSSGVQTLAAGRGRVQPSARRDVIEFVAWPGAAALPSFESGELVRTELPASVLPLLGLRGELEAGRTRVPADVIVGQDGRPRAVRLVSDLR